MKNMTWQFVGTSFFLVFWPVYSQKPLPLLFKRPLISTLPSRVFGKSVFMQSPSPVNCLFVCSRVMYLYCTLAWQFETVFAEFPTASIQLLAPEGVLWEGFWTGLVYLLSLAPYQRGAWRHRTEDFILL